MAALNAPVALAAPRLIELSAVVGVPAVFQQTPWAVGLGTPRLAILPLPVAVVAAMADTAWVVTVGAMGLLVKDTSPP